MVVIGICLHIQGGARVGLQLSVWEVIQKLLHNSTRMSLVSGAHGCVCHTPCCDPSPLSCVHVANIVSQSVGWLFTLLMASFATQTFLIWMKSRLSNLSFVAVFLVVYLRDYCLIQRFAHMFSFFIYIA